MYTVSDKDLAEIQAAVQALQDAAETLLIEVERDVPNKKTVISKTVEALNASKKMIKLVDQTHQ